MLKGHSLGSATAHFLQTPPFPRTQYSGIAKNCWELPVPATHFCCVFPCLGIFPFPSVHLIILIPLIIPIPPCFPIRINSYFTLTSWRAVNQGDLSSSRQELRFFEWRSIKKGKPLEIIHHSSGFLMRQPSSPECSMPATLAFPTVLYKPERLSAHQVFHMLLHIFHTSLQLLQSCMPCFGQWTVRRSDVFSFWAKQLRTSVPPISFNVILLSHRQKRMK